MCPPARALPAAPRPAEPGPEPRSGPAGARYLPALVMIISVPISWKRFQSSAPCRSTRGAGGVGSGEPGLEPLGEPPGEAGGEAARKVSSQPPAERAEEARGAGGARTFRPRGAPSAPAGSRRRARAWSAALRRDDPGPYRSLWGVRAAREAPRSRARLPDAEPPDQTPPAPGRAAAGPRCVASGTFRLDTFSVTVAGRSLLATQRENALASI